MVGCAGSFPSPESPSSCYLVEADDRDGRRWRILLDLGNGSVGPLQRYLAPAHLSDIDAVLLSHLHPDHCIDLCGLYVALVYNPAGPLPARIPVYGPQGTFSRLERAYGEHETGSLAKAYRVWSWTDAEPVQIGPFTITPHRVEHPIEAFGLRVEADGAVLAYSGDTDVCEGLLRVADRADLLLAEASFIETWNTPRGVHLTGRRAGETAQQAQAASLLLTHYPSWTDPAIIAAEAGEVYDGPVEVARPGLTVDVEANASRGRGGSAVDEMVGEPD